jgi:hypothetical protein
VVASIIPPPNTSVSARAVAVVNFFNRLNFIFIFPRLLLEESRHPSLFIEIKYPSRKVACQHK